MRKVLFVLLAAVIGFTFSAPIVSYDAEAQAAAPRAPLKKRITHALGEPRPATCRELSRAGATNVWQGSFRGERFSTPGIGRSFVGGLFCFETETECRRWLYQMQTFNDGAIRSNYCQPF